MNGRWIGATAGRSRQPPSGAGGFSRLRRCTLRSCRSRPPSANSGSPASTTTKGSDSLESALYAECGAAAAGVRPRGGRAPCPAPRRSRTGGEDTPEPIPPASSQRAGPAAAAAEVAIIALALRRFEQGRTSPQTRTPAVGKRRVARRGDDPRVAHQRARLPRRASELDRGRHGCSEQALRGQALRVLRQAIGSTGWVAWSHSNLGLAPPTPGSSSTEALERYRRARSPARTNSASARSWPPDCLIRNRRCRRQARRHQPSRPPACGDRSHPR